MVLPVRVSPWVFPARCERRASDGRIYATGLWDCCSGNRSGVVYSDRSDLFPILRSSRYTVLSGNSRNIHSYSFDYTVYGGYPGRAPVRIEVRADTVLSVVARSAGAVLPSAGWPTVDSLFSEIAHGIAAGNDQLQVQYHSSLGYPVDIETNPHVGDGGLSINVENLRLN
jgi:hypothetical protein